MDLLLIDIMIFICILLVNRLYDQAKQSMGTLIFCEINCILVTWTLNGWVPIYSLTSLQLPLVVESIIEGTTHLERQEKSDSVTNTYWCNMCGLQTHCSHFAGSHYSDIIISMIVSQITSLVIVCSTICPDIDKKKPSKLCITGLCEGIHRWLVDSAHKGPVMWKMFPPFDDVIMINEDFGGRSMYLGPG